MQETHDAISDERVQEFFGGKNDRQVVKKMNKRLGVLKHQGHTFVRRIPRIGRNDLCPCGSGKKFKKCHIDKVQ